ncbi:hypothetical protein BX616_008661, partial [Lobosporangium transversale]
MSNITINTESAFTLLTGIFWLVAEHLDPSKKDLDLHKKIMILLGSKDNTPVLEKDSTLYMRGKAQENDHSSSATKITDELTSLSSSVLTSGLERLSSTPEPGSFSPTSEPGSFSPTSEPGSFSHTLESPH